MKFMRMYGALLRQPDDDPTTSLLTAILPINFLNYACNNHTRVIDSPSAYISVVMPFLYLYNQRLVT